MYTGQRNTVITGENEVEGRNEKGRFTQGNKLAKGNPENKRKARLRREMQRAVTPEEIRDITLKIIQMAKNGDLVAVRIVFEYALGKPTSAQDLHSDDSNEQVSMSLVKHHFNLLVRSLNLSYPAMQEISYALDHLDLGEYSDGEEEEDV